MALSPPPTTTSGLLRKRGKAPSHTAQAETPRFLNLSSDGKPEIIRSGTRRDDQRMSGDRLTFQRLQLKRSFRKIDGDDVIRDDAGAKVLGLLPH